MARFTTSETQHVKVVFEVRQPIMFPDNTTAEAYDDPDDFANDLADTIIDCCDGDINDYEVSECGFDEDGLVPGETYYIDIACSVGISGTCSYDPGRSYGDPYYCYPSSVDDVEYEDGMITNCNEAGISTAFPMLTNISVELGEVSDEGELELDFDDYPEDDYEPDYDRYDDRYDD